MSTDALSLDRRGFLKATASAGLVVGFHVPFAGSAD